MITAIADRLRDPGQQRLPDGFLNHSRALERDRDGPGSLATRMTSIVSRFASSARFEWPLQQGPERDGRRSGLSDISANQRGIA